MRLLAARDGPRFSRAPAFARQPRQQIPVDAPFFSTLGRFLDLFNVLESPPGNGASGQ
jgi:hypothetical protein